jgi:hypothetical protein
MVEGIVPKSKSDRRKKVRETVKLLKYDGPVVIKHPRKVSSNTNEDFVIN